MSIVCLQLMNARGNKIFLYF